MNENLSSGSHAKQQLAVITAESTGPVESAMHRMLTRVFQGHNVRVVVIDGEPWFVGKDVCEVLGYVDPTNAMKQHCRGVVKRHPIIDSLGRAQDVRVIPERDLYRLVMRSKMPAAEQFEEWVVSNVLPDIRKTGGHIDRPEAVPTLPQTYIAALEDLLTAKKAEALALEQRDEAIRTKALIGSKREASAMATASAAKRQANALRDRLGECAEHATITAVENVTGDRYEWLPLRRWCKANGVKPVSVPDKRYGDVKSWPRAAWLACFNVRIDQLFDTDSGDSNVH